MKALITRGKVKGVEVFNAYLLVGGQLLQTTRFSEQGARQWLKEQRFKYEIQH